MSAKVRGFSLLESLVALAFLALAALGVLAAFVFTSRLDTRRESQHQAALLALDSMEEARAILKVQFDTDVSLPTSPHPEAPNFQLERTQKPVGQDLGMSENSLKEVRVTISWGPPEDTHNYVLEERFAEPKG